MVKRVLTLIFLVFVLPIAARALWYGLLSDGPADWSRADWSSAAILPEPATHRPALLRIYAARTGRWKGVVAHHSWIVVKPDGAARYTRFDKVGWGSPVRTNAWPADARWFGNAPELVLALDGPEAERLIPAVAAAVRDYPYGHGGDYRVWPGPNSNTFVAWVIDRVPDLHVALLPTAIGKDYRPASDVAGWTPSRTGLRLQLGGYLGLTVGWVEGVEVNLLGLVAGLDLRRPALKLPGWGRIGLPLDPEPSAA